MPDSTCAFPDCGSTVKADRLCGGHEDQRRSGRDLRPIYRGLDARFWSKVDKTSSLDGCWTWTAARDRFGYGAFRLSKGVVVRAHRHAWSALRGDPGTAVLDHTCHNPPCVNPEHLRLVTQKQNTENRSGPQRASRTGIRGVTWKADRRKWVAQAQQNGKTYYGGIFVDLEEAAEAARQLRLRLFTHNDLDRKAS